MWGSCITMTINSYQWPSERTTYKKSVEFQNQDQLAALTEQISSLTRLVLASRNAPVRNFWNQRCDFAPQEEVEDINYVGGQYYNNFQNRGFSVANGMIDEPRKQPLEDLMKEFIKGTDERVKEMDAHTKEIDARTKSSERQMDARLKALEVQMGQIVTILENQQEDESYSSTTELYPTEEGMIMTLMEETKKDEPSMLVEDEKETEDER